MSVRNRWNAVIFSACCFYFALYYLPFRYLDTAKALEVEAKISGKSLEICDNIDLQTIVQVTKEFLN